MEQENSEQKSLERIEELVNFLIYQQENLISIHSRVNMDTQEDRELHQKVVREFSLTLEHTKIALDVEFFTQQHKS